MGSSSSRPSSQSPASPPPSLGHGTPNLGRSPCGKRKRRAFPPFLRSLSCGTSSSLWRTESSPQDDSLAGSSLVKKPAASNLCGLPARDGKKSLDVGSSSVLTQANVAQVSDSVRIFDSSKLPVSDFESNCVSNSNHDHSRQRSQNGQREHGEVEVHRCSSAGCNFDSHCPGEIGISGRAYAMDSTAHVISSSAPGPSHLCAGSNIDIDNTTDTSASRNLPNLDTYRTLQAASGRPRATSQMENGDSEVGAAMREASDARRSESLELLHLEALGLVTQSPEGSSSNVLRGEASGREARRNSRRRLWDALTRATSRRRTLPPAFLVASEDIDGLGPWNDGWGLFDWSSTVEGGVTGEGALLMSRTSEMDERRQRIRPQVWALQNFSRGMEGASMHSRHCASRRHPNSRCSCEAFIMTEETSTRASISRIVMLAEALFEVLDEIHRQSVALSRSTSLSLVSSPAPEDVVDSFPLRMHKKTLKVAAAVEESAECYICLIEYEEGDQVRTLPCYHEFHKSCIDKWLKEVHRVCPLCRGNVCDRASGSSQLMAM